MTNSYRPAMPGVMKALTKFAAGIDDDRRATALRWSSNSAYRQSAAQVGDQSGLFSRGFHERGQSLT